ncbi:2-acylglycerol O-acyltransferase 2-like [Musca vetustissima]|uniref:2-acylglycerol O-acyltransferase 2-like n=1 Tax=Musca vetustissima TaxID=27455 RepID=UPI002AB61B41|nr:2-acylglycerol O-acyltransferase 2-like [Musca vetustissima]
MTEPPSNGKHDQSTTQEEIPCAKNRKQFEEPLKGFVETLVAGLYINLFMYMPFICWFLNGVFLICSGYLGKALYLLYFAYIYMDHKRNSSLTRGLGYLPMRTSRIAEYLRSYFPVELVKTAELPPNRNYVIATFPHGIIGTGISVNMGLSIGKWLELFPGVRPKAATLDMYFLTPIMRELIRGWSLVTCSKEGLLQQLNRSCNPHHPHNIDGYTSNAVAILVGGAHEALDCHPGQYILTLKNRKGFVKIAIKSGSPIVPSFSFGEVDILDQKDNPPGSKLRNFQIAVKNKLGIAPLIVTGRGLLKNGFGLLPHRKRIVQVIGSPIDVEKMDNPDPKYVDEIHQKVMTSLQEMFEKYKYEYLENPKDAKLIIN